MASRTIGIIGRTLRGPTYVEALGADVKVVGVATLIGAAREPALQSAETIVVEVEGGRLPPAAPLHEAFPQASILAAVISGMVPAEADARGAGYTAVALVRNPAELVQAVRLAGGRKGTAAPARSALVMIVEDDAALRDLGEQLLEDEGYHVLAAENGPAALALLEAHTPDLVLLDVVMPGMDGREVCRRLRERPATRDVPVIFVSALDVLGDQLKAFEAGGNDYVCKPYDEKDLLRKVSSLLAMSASRRTLERVGKK